MGRSHAQRTRAIADREGEQRRMIGRDEIAAAGDELLGLARGELGERVLAEELLRILHDMAGARRMMDEGLQLGNIVRQNDYSFSK